jgi:purine-binding chemotaxis protein CheW
MSDVKPVVESGASLLCFYLGSDPYAVDLQTVREISEVMPIQPVSNTIDAFSGLMNLRGELIGVVDLRIRFGYKSANHDSNAFIVFDTDKGPLAAIVDRLEKVHTLNSAADMRQANIPSQVNREFVMGIADFEGKIFQIIDLRRILSREELVKFAAAKKAA